MFISRFRESKKSIEGFAWEDYEGGTFGISVVGHAWASKGVFITLSW